MQFLDYMHETCSQSLSMSNNDFDDFCTNEENCRINNMRSVNLGYIRGIYNSLFEKNDEELENFDINLHDGQKTLFEEMTRSFEGFGPISKRNIINGLNLIFRSAFDENLWRSAVPHDLPLIEVTDRLAYLERLIFAITNNAPVFLDERNFLSMKSGLMDWIFQNDPCRVLTRQCVSQQRIFSEGVLSWHIFRCDVALP